MMCNKIKFKTSGVINLCVFTDVVHRKMGSDGESDQASGTSSDEVQSPVRVRMRNLQQRISNEVMHVQSQVSNKQTFQQVDSHLMLCSNYILG